MTQIAVVADDLTGANATGVLLRKEGFSAGTLLAGCGPGGVVDCDCLIFPTNSRSIDRAEARKRVLEATKALAAPGIRLYSKRIDSTLRGNLGAETDAMLEALGDEWIAVVVACFPRAKRITVGGRLLVDSVPLHLTEAAADPRNPIRTPVVKDIFLAQTGHRARSIYIEELSGGPDRVAGLIAGAAAEGIRIVIVDAMSEGDLETIALGAARSGVPFVAVDPGAFTAACAKAMAAERPQAAGKKTLAVVGSVNGIAAGQVFRFLEKTRCHNVFLDTGKAIGSPQEHEGEIRRVKAEIAAAASDFDVLSVVGSGICPLCRIDLGKETAGGKSGDDISGAINGMLAEIARDLLTDDKSFGGLYTCGGDISVAVCGALGASALELHSEVVPLASFGELRGGPFDGLKFVTKGGMVGDEDAIVTCVEYLQSKI